MEEFALKSPELPMLVADAHDKDKALHSFYGHSNAKCRAAFGARKAGLAVVDVIAEFDLLREALTAAQAEIERLKADHEKRCQACA